jgi:hypothetical protein
VNKTEKTRALKREISGPKSQLLSIYSRMQSGGLARDAEQFGNIIARLEDFQNR